MCVYLLKCSVNPTFPHDDNVFANMWRWLHVDGVCGWPISNSVKKTSEENIGALSRRTIWSLSAAVQCNGSLNHTISCSIHERAIMYNRVSKPCECAACSPDELHIFPTGSKDVRKWMYYQNIRSKVNDCPRTFSPDLITDLSDTNMHMKKLLLHKMLSWKHLFFYIKNSVRHVGK